MTSLVEQPRPFPSLRRIVHCIGAAALHYSGALTFYSWFRRRILNRCEVAVIGLHRVLTPEQVARSLSEPSMILLLPTFDRLVRWLKTHCRIVGLNELGSLAQKDLVRPLCMLTFDDGWRDTFENACPVLNHHSVRAALFVATGLVGGGACFWVERLARLWKDESLRDKLKEELRSRFSAGSGITLSDAIAALKTIPLAEREKVIASIECDSGCSSLDPVDAFMKWENVAASTTYLDVASHTVDHALLTCEAQSDVKRELVDSKHELESRLNIKVSAFAYPSGAHDELVRAAVENAGYSVAFTTRSGMYRFGDDRLTVPRILLHEGNVTGLTGKFSPAMLHLRLMGWR